MDGSDVHVCRPCLHANNRHDYKTCLQQGRKHCVWILCLWLFCDQCGLPKVLWLRKFLAERQQRCPAGFLHTTCFSKTHGSPNFQRFLDPIFWFKVHVWIRTTICVLLRKQMLFHMHSISLTKKCPSLGCFRPRTSTHHGVIEISLSCSKQRVQCRWNNMFEPGTILIFWTPEWWVVEATDRHADCRSIQISWWWGCPLSWSLSVVLQLIAAQSCRRRFCGVSALRLGSWPLHFWWVPQDRGKGVRAATNNFDVHKLYKTVFRKHTFHV